MSTEGQMLLLLLLSGWVLDSHLQDDTGYRGFHMVPVKKTWSEAQRHCRENFMDLATIQDPQASTDVQKLVQSGKFWIGLYYTWRWSEGNKEIQLDQWFNDWTKDELTPGGCVGICTHSKWKVRSCEEEHVFSCYSAPEDIHIVVWKLKTWSEAQSYCRNLYTDLSSVWDKEVSNFIAAKLLNATTENDPMAWIGLHSSRWTWSEGSDSNYRQWANKEPDLSDETKRCVLVDADSTSAEWHNSHCSDMYPFLCQSFFRSSSMKIVKIRVNTGSTDLHQPNIQDSIIQKLQQELEEGGLKEQVKLSWRIQPDGQVFQRQEQQEKETPPPVDCQRQEL